MLVPQKNTNSDENETYKAAVDEEEESVSARGEEETNSVAAGKNDVFVVAVEGRDPRLELVVHGARLEIPAQFRRVGEGEHGDAAIGVADNNFRYRAWLLP